MRNQQRDWLVHQRGLHIVTQGSFEQTMSLVLLLFVSFLSLVDHVATENAELKPCGLPVLGRSSSVQLDKSLLSSLSSKKSLPRTISRASSGAGGHPSARGGGLMSVRAICIQL